MNIQHLFCDWTRLAVVAGVSLAGVAAVPAAPFTMGTLGDSYTDEYTTSSAQRDEHRSLAEIIDIHYSGPFGGGTGSGVFGEWNNSYSPSEPRRAGYEFNWARSAASTGQPTGSVPGSRSLTVIGQQLNGPSGGSGLLKQLDDGDFNVVYLSAGVNNYDFVDNAENNLPSNTFLEDLEDWTVGDLQQIVTEVRSVDPNAKIVIGNVVDRAAWPLNRTNSPPSDEVKQAYSDSIDRTNARIQQFANALGIPILDQHQLLEKLTFGADPKPIAGQDYNALTDDTTGENTSRPQVTLAGFYLNNSLVDNTDDPGESADDRGPSASINEVDFGDGVKPFVSLYGDWAHPSTAFQGFYANVLLTALRDIHGVDIGDEPGEGLLSWQEIFDIAWQAHDGLGETPDVDLDGFSFGSYQDTGGQFDPKFGGVFDYNTYILIPEPGTAALLLAGSGLILSAGRRRRAN